MRFAEVGVQADGAAVGLGGVLHPSQRREHGAEVVMAFCEIRLEANRAPVGIHGLVQAPGGFQRVAQAAVEERDLGFEFDGPANRFDRNPVLSDLMGDQPEQVQRVGLTGIDFQNLDVDRLRLCQLAGPLMPQTGFQDAAHAR